MSIDPRFTPPIAPTGEVYNDLTKYPEGTYVWGCADDVCEGYHVRTWYGWSAFHAVHPQAFLPGTVVQGHAMTPSRTAELRAMGIMPFSPGGRV